MPEIGQCVVSFETPWFRVFSKTVLGMPGTTEAQQFFVVKPDDYVTVLAVTTDNHILLVRQYRPAVEDYTLELPSGHVDQGELPAEAAKRELLEETGYHTNEVELLGCLAPDTGRLGNRLWCYFAPHVAPNGNAQLVLEEGIELVSCSLADLAKLIVEGRLDHALNLAVILLAMAKGNLPPVIGQVGAKQNAR